jgi:hypothetical protein
VSALAYYLEDEGLPTVAVSLIRAQTEKVGNPRSVWVPFELGRPLGAPSDPQFQKKVISAALQLLTAAPGPVILEDFPEDDPTSVDRVGWLPPFDLAEMHIELADESALSAALKQEVSEVAAFYQRFIAANRRTTVGISGLDIDQCIAYMASYLVSPTPVSPFASISPVQALRWAIDDVKAYYLEAMSTGSEMPSSRQMQAWFWDRTLAARTIIALRQKLLASDDDRSKAVGRLNLVPGVQVLRLGLS